MAKLYDYYFTHDAANYVPRLAGLRRVIRNAILATSLGYDGPISSRLQKALGRVVSWIGPIREMVELSVMTLGALPGGTLLDVGCGNGQFLAELRALGWQVFGVEPDRKAARVAREQFGLSVHGCTLEEAGFPDDSFDAITISHVIEHVWDPLATLRECRRVLKHGCRLVVVTPNIEGLGHRLFGKAWLHLDPPRHLHLFSSRAMLEFADRAGLCVLELWTTARKARRMWAASRLIARNRVLPGGLPEKLGLWLCLEGLALQAVEHWLCHMIKAGDEIVLIASK